MGYQSICRELVEAGTDVNQCDVSGRSAITFAAEHGEMRICDFLVKKGADTQLADMEGEAH